MSVFSPRKALAGIKSFAATFDIDAETLFDRIAKTPSLQALCNMSSIDDLAAVRRLYNIESGIGDTMLDMSQSLDAGLEDEVIAALRNRDADDAVDGDELTVEDLASRPRTPEEILASLPPPPPVPPHFTLGAGLLPPPPPMLLPPPPAPPPPSVSSADPSLASICVAAAELDRQPDHAKGAARSSSDTAGEAKTIAAVATAVGASASAATAGTATADDANATAAAAGTAGAEDADMVINSVTQRVAYQRFLNKMTTRKASTSHPELVKLFENRGTRASLFVEFFKNDGDLDAVSLSHTRKQFASQKARLRWRPMTQADLLVKHHQATFVVGPAYIHNQACSVIVTPPHVEFVLRLSCVVPTAVCLSSRSSTRSACCCRLCTLSSSRSAVR
jgi:hypothetical protein